MDRSMSLGAGGSGLLNFDKHSLLQACHYLAKLYFIIVCNIFTKTSLCFILEFFLNICDFLAFFPSIQGNRSGVDFSKFFISQSFTKLLYIDIKICPCLCFTHREAVLRLNLIKILNYIAIIKQSQNIWCLVMKQEFSLS